MSSTFARVKKTNERVFPLYDIDIDHKMCVFPLGFAGKKGNRSTVQSVRKDNLIEEKQEPKIVQSGSGTAT